MNLVPPLPGTSDVVQTCWVLLSELPNHTMCCWQWNKRLLAGDTGRKNSSSDTHRPTEGSQAGASPLHSISASTPWALSPK